jgi:hypothetical protein
MFPINVVEKRGTYTFLSVTVSETAKQGRGNTPEVLGYAYVFFGTISGQSSYPQCYCYINGYIARGGGAL